MLILQPEFVLKTVLELKDYSLIQVISNAFLNVQLATMVTHFSGYVYRVVLTLPQAIVLMLGDCV